jgi:hypothetical protein
MKFIRLTNRLGEPVVVNRDAISCYTGGDEVQSNGERSQIWLIGDKVIFVKESFEVLDLMIVNADQRSQRDQ